MSRLSKNIAYNLLGQILLLGLSFVTVKHIFHRLGQDSLGIIYFAVTLSAVLTQLLEMGMGSTTVKEIAAHATADPPYVHQFLRTFSALYWSGYLLMATAVWLGAPLLVTKWVNLRALDPVVAIQALRILGMGVLLVFPRMFYAGVISGLQRMEFNNLIDVSRMALQQLGTLAILIFGGNLLSVAVWITLSSVLGILANLFVCLQFFPLRALIPGFSMDAIRRNWAFTSRMASISFLAMIHFQADKAIVSKLLPLGVFGYYSVASGAISRGTSVTGAVAQAAFPSFSTLFKQRDRAGLISQYHKLQDLLCFANVPLLAVFPFACVHLFSYLLDAKAAHMLVMPVIFLSIGSYMSGTLAIPYFFSLAVEKPNLTMRLSFYALFVVVPVNVALIYFFGLNGAGSSWVCYHIFMYIYLVPRICSECLEMPSWKWFAHVLRPTLLAATTYGGAWTLLELSGNSSILLSFSAFVAASSLYLVGAYFLIGEELRHTLFVHVQAVRLRIVLAIQPSA